MRRDIRTARQERHIQLTSSILSSPNRPQAIASISNRHECRSSRAGIAIFRSEKKKKKNKTTNKQTNTQANKKKQISQPEDCCARPKDEIRLIKISQASFLCLNNLACWRGDFGLKSQTDGVSWRGNSRAIVKGGQVAVFGRKQALVAVNLKETSEICFAFQMKSSIVHPVRTELSIDWTSGSHARSWNVRRVGRWSHSEGVAGNGRTALVRNRFSIFIQRDSWCAWNGRSSSRAHRVQSQTGPFVSA